MDGFAFGSLLNQVALQEPTAQGLAIAQLLLKHGAQLKTNVRGVSTLEMAISGFTRKRYGDFGYTDAVNPDKIKHRLEIIKLIVEATAKEQRKAAFEVNVQNIPHEIQEHIRDILNQACMPDKVSMTE